jgi:hypothetical protein
VPPTVAKLLQAEFKARIAPRLGAVRKGGVAKFYARLRNWTLAAQDAGLVKAQVTAGELPSTKAKPSGTAALAGMVRGALLEGLRSDLQRQGDACIGQSDRNAMGKAFSAFAELARESALKPGDAEKIKRCVRFELQWTSELNGQQVGGVLKDIVSTRVQLGYSQGSIFGTNLVQQVLTFTAAGCTTSLLSTPKVTFTVHRLEDPSLNFWEDEITPLVGPMVYHDILPGNAAARWLLSCPKVPAINTVSAWVFLYIVAHFEDLDRDLFRIRLQPRAQVYAYRAYRRTVNGAQENTEYVLRHTPQ